MHEKILRAHKVKYLWAVQTISLFRLCAAVVFSGIAFWEGATFWAATLYGLAMCSDLVDGLLARRTGSQSQFGTMIDIISDKCLTIASTLYAAKRGFDLAPLVFIATREIIVLGLRAVVVDRLPLLPSSRYFGGTMVMALWGTTLLVIVANPESKCLTMANICYWGCAIIYLLNLISRIYRSRLRIVQLVSEDRD